MNLLKTFILGLFLINFFHFGFSETIVIDGVELPVQNDVEVIEVYDNSKNWFVYILITGFSIIFAVTIGIVYRQYNLVYNADEKHFNSWKEE